MVKAWKEKVVIPTYEVGKPEKNPIFLEKRVYQGSSGVVYPYPVIESISNEKTDHEWSAVFIENEYIKVMILPELGGRVQMAYDKIKQRHFVYYNHVIKPALVGLAGPWISGGIEFNWPQHHRPSTYMPVDCTIEEHGGWLRYRMGERNGAYVPPKRHGRIYTPSRMCFPRNKRRIVQPYRCTADILVVGQSRCCGQRPLPFGISARYQCCFRPRQTCRKFVPHCDGNLL